MKLRINMIGIFTDAMEPMKYFYEKILGFEVLTDMGEYVEFKNEGVRFAICLRKVMYESSPEYKVKPEGQRFELAFECHNVDDLDKTFEGLLEKGAKSIHGPEDMPWGQRTALFADPDGNIHELFVNL